MLHIADAKYLGLKFPELKVGGNATIGMGENCAVVIKDCLIDPPMSRIAVAELEEILSYLFGQKTEVTVYEPARSTPRPGTNPLGEIG